MTWSTRPTLRCLKDDLGLSLPPIAEPLDTLDHELLDDARRADEAPTERIRSIDDQVLLKAKPGGSRWRGALWQDRSTDPSPAWLVAAGIRKDGDRTDFYDELCAACTRERTRRNAAGTDPRPGKKTFSEHLLPTYDDRLRLAVERQAAAVLDAQKSVRNLVLRAQAQPGTPLSLNALGTDIEAWVYRNVGSFDELYLILAVRGSSPAVEAILKMAAPDLSADDWDVVTAPVHRPGTPGEIVYATLLEIPDLRAAPNPASRPAGTGGTTP